MASRRVSLGPVLDICWGNAAVGVELFCAIEMSSGTEGAVVLLGGPRLLKTGLPSGERGVALGVDLSSHTGALAMGWGSGEADCVKASSIDRLGQQRAALVRGTTTRFVASRLGAEHGTPERAAGPTPITLGLRPADPAAEHEQGGPLHGPCAVRAVRWNTNRSAAHWLGVASEGGIVHCVSPGPRLVPANAANKPRRSRPARLQRRQHKARRLGVSESSEGESDSDGAGRRSEDEDSGDVADAASSEVAAEDGDDDADGPAADADPDDEPS